MVETKLDCVVVTRDEARNRACFLVEPLRRRHHAARTQRLKLDQSTFLEICRWFWWGKKPDIIVFIGLGLYMVLPICAARLSGVPVVLRLGGHPLQDNSDLLANLAYASLKRRIKGFVNYVVAKLFLKLPRYVICVNDDLADRVKGDLSRDAEIFVVPQFCDGEAVGDRSFVVGSACCLTVTNLNFMSKAVGVIWLIKQLAAFCERTGRSVTFSVAGDGVFRSVVEDFLASYDGNRLLFVKLIGFVHDVDSLYSSADFFLYHSEHDGTPNVILEAKRWGVPTLVNDYRPFRSIISHGETGWLFRNSHEFLTIFADMVEDVSLRRKVSAGARLEHKNCFSKEAVGIRLENVLKKICRRHVRRKRY